MDRVADFLLDSKDAWLSLRRKPVRSLLSGLGIAIGVLALVAMLSISEGAKRKALEKINSLGVSTIRVEYSAPLSTFGATGVLNLSQGLTRRDAKQIDTWLGSLGQVSYFSRADDVSAFIGAQSTLLTAMGVSQYWLDVEGLGLVEGRPFVPEDVSNMRRVCIAGNDVASILWLNLGDTLRLNNEPCKIIGILKQKGRLLTEGTGLSTLDFDNLLIMPHVSFPFRKISGGVVALDGLVISLNQVREESILMASKQIEELLRHGHRGVQDFRLVVPVTLMQEARETQFLFRLIMGSIAGLSLLVGGIGVMNIMLANISEQTREIGLRLAVGATKARIVSLYLWHSMLLCLIGGAVGLVGGVFAALTIQYYAGWSVAFSGFAIILGPIFAMLTGLVFGLHPAWRAASLSPTEALREA